MTISPRISAAAGADVLQPDGGIVGLEDLHELAVSDVAGRRFAGCVPEHERGKEEDEKEQRHAGEHLRLALFAFFLHGSLLGDPDTRRRPYHCSACASMGQPLGRHRPPSGEGGYKSKGGVVFLKHRDFSERS